MKDKNAAASPCPVCFRHCRLSEGQLGFCRGRRGSEGGHSVACDNYGRITSIALDPIEKKPLARFHPGSMIVSVGSYGCNLACPFCQNDSISYAGPGDARYLEMTPGEIAEMASKAVPRGNIGLAFTYNEPLIGFEFVRDTARLVHERGLVNVLVTNGCAGLPVLEELGPHIDAMNIDIKGFTDSYYHKLGGDLNQVKEFIARAVELCHVELTTLIVPGENDSDEEIRRISSWIRGLKGGRGSRIPLHVTRFFPHRDMAGREATPPSSVRHLAEIARKQLDYVYVGNC